MTSAYGPSMFTTLPSVSAVNCRVKVNVSCRYGMYGALTYSYTRCGSRP